MSLVFHYFIAITISRLITENYLFLRNTCLSRRAHSYVVYSPVDRAIPYENNSFFS